MSDVTTIARPRALVLAGLLPGPLGPDCRLTAPAAAFVGSHALAKRIGAWPSVLAVAAASAGASWVLADRAH